MPSARLGFGTSQTVSESIRSSLTASSPPDRPINLSIIWKATDMDHGNAYSSLPTTIHCLSAAVSWDPFRQYTAPRMWQADVWQMPAASNTAATGRPLSCACLSSFRDGLFTIEMSSPPGLLPHDSLSLVMTGRGRCERQASSLIPNGYVETPSHSAHFASSMITGPNWSRPGWRVAVLVLVVGCSCAYYMLGIIHRPGVEFFRKPTRTLKKVSSPRPISSSATLARTSSS